MRVAFDIEKFRQSEEEKDRRTLEEMVAKTARMQRHSEASQEALSRGCRPASSGEYSAFIRKWISNGGRPRYSRDYPFGGKDAANRWRYWIAKKDFVLPCLEGADSVIVLVPDGIKYTAPNGIGHSTVLFANGAYDGLGGVEIFSDT
jgi:hypothetical protein